MEKKKKTYAEDSVLKKGETIQVTDVGNNDTNKPYTFETKVLGIIDKERVVIEYKGKKVNAIWRGRYKDPNDNHWVVATYYTDMSIWEGGQYETEDIQYDSEEAQREADEVTKRIVDAAKKRGKN